MAARQVAGKAARAVAWAHLQRTALLVDRCAAHTLVECELEGGEGGVVALCRIEFDELRVDDDVWVCRRARCVRFRQVRPRNCNSLDGLVGCRWPNALEHRTIDGSTCLRGNLAGDVPRVCALADLRDVARRAARAKESVPEVCTPRGRRGL